MKKDTTRFAGLEFENEDVILDFSHFEQCGFKNCNLIIHGAGPMGLDRCHFVGCKVVFSGQAANTLQILTSLLHGGFRDTIEATIANIRKGSLPQHPSPDKRTN